MFTKGVYTLVSIHTSISLLCQLGGPQSSSITHSALCWFLSRKMSRKIGAHRKNVSYCWIEAQDEPGALVMPGNKEMFKYQHNV